MEKLLPEHKKDIVVFVNDNDVVPRAAAYDIVDIVRLMRVADTCNPDITLTQMYIHKKYRSYIKNTGGVRKFAHAITEGVSAVKDYASNLLGSSSGSSMLGGLFGSKPKKDEDDDTENWDKITKERQRKKEEEEKKSKNVIKSDQKLKGGDKKINSMSEIDKMEKGEDQLLADITKNPKSYYDT